MINQEAVDNFLCSLDPNLDIDDHLRNAERDAKIYRWNGNTLRQIIKGIKQAYVKNFSKKGKPELTAFDIYIRNKLKRQKDREDQEMLDQMLVELKEKHEKERQNQIAYLNSELKKIGV